MRSPLPDATSIRKDVRSTWPGKGIREFRIHRAGWTNLILEDDRTWMIRIPRWRSSANELGREVRLLQYLSTRLSSRIPEPSIIGTLKRPSGWPFFAYRKIPGEPLKGISALSPTQAGHVGAYLKRLASELEACPQRQLRKMGLDRRDPPTYAGRIESLKRRYQRLAAERLPSRLDSRLSEALDETIAAVRDSGYRPALIHNDLWPSHILWDSRVARPRGVIDWEDACLGDPARDLVAFAELPSAIQTSIAESRAPGADTRFWDRLELYRRILPLQGYLFGIAIKNRSIRDRSLEELRRSLRPQRRTGH